MPFNLEYELKNTKYEDNKERILENIQDVHNEQLTLNMLPRNDSKLTFMYATNKLSMTAREVAHELMCVDYIFQNTNYQQIIEETMREVAGYIKKTYKISWDLTWALIRRYLPTALKMYCIRTYHITLPEKFDEKKYFVLNNVN